MALIIVHTAIFPLISILLVGRLLCVRYLEENGNIPDILVWTSKCSSSLAMKLVPTHFLNFDTSNECPSNQCRRIWNIGGISSNYHIVKIYKNCLSARWPTPIDQYSFLTAETFLIASQGICLKRTLSANVLETRRRHSFTGNRLVFSGYGFGRGVPRAARCKLVEVGAWRRRREGRF